MRKILFLFGDLNDDDVDWLVRNGTLQHHPGGSVLIREGTEPPALMIIVEGWVSVRVERNGRGEVARAAAGEILGEVSFVDSRPASATVVAGEPTTVLALDRARLQSKLGTDSGFAARFYRALAVSLADRLRGQVQAREVDAARALSGDLEVFGEMDVDALEKVSLAGARFDALVKRLRTPC